MTKSVPTGKNRKTLDQAETDNVKGAIAPMEALLVDAIPKGREWQYEPKWDGFRCIAFKRKSKVILQSKAARQLGRYFPELVETISKLAPADFILDGEIVVPVGNGLDFDQLLQRIHPAESRVRKLAAEFPAHLIVFDLLKGEDGKSLLKEPLGLRRTLLEKFARNYFPKSSRLHLSPQTRDLAEAEIWLRQPGLFLDGLIAKRLDLPYDSGQRHAMQKFKKIRTADCVLGGFRYAEKTREVGSLLLGLYDQGLLHHVGFTSGFKKTERAELLAKLRPYMGPPGFTGQAPGGPSRWSTERTAQWEPLKPKLVVEVSYDHVTGGRFRHGAEDHSLAADKRPEQCTLEQLEKPGANNALLKLLG